MIRSVRWLFEGLSLAPSRRGMQAAQMAPLNEWIRVFSYTAAILGGAVFVPDGGRYLGVLIISVVGLGGSIRGLVLRGARPQARAAFLDLVLSPIVVAVALGSPLFSSVVAVSVAVLLYASFRVPLRLVLIGVVLGTAGTLTSSVVLPATNTAAFDLAAAIFVVSILVGTAGVLVFEWRRAQKTLLVTEAALETILAEAPVILCRVSPTLEVMSVAGSAADPRWAVGSSASEVLPRELSTMVSRAIETGRVVGDLQVGQRAFEVTCSPSPEGVVITGFDVTERQAARAELEEIIKTKDEFVASISHELRTPLTAVLGFSTELQRSGVVTKEFAPFLDTVVEQSAEMAAIIDDLLVAVRADLDIFTVADRPVHLSEEIAHTVRALDRRISRRIEVTGCPVDVRTDSGRVRQILRNLLVNADRYGGPNIAVDIGAVAGYGQVTVRDDGPEIPAEFQELMFRAFESTGRVEGRTAALGLGLSVSRRLAGLMGGSLEYHHVDGWSCFVLKLPLCVPESTLDVSA